MTIKFRPQTALAITALLASSSAWAAIPAAHVYHNHMPNFWPFYAVDVGAKYNSTGLGQPIRYSYDAEVIELKNNPPPGYRYYLPVSAGGGIMPHDDLLSYYSHHAKTGAYLSWPMQAASEMQTFSSRRGQVHLTMTGSLINNVNDLSTRRNVPGYDNANWGASWRSSYQNLSTVNGNKTLDLIHMTGHHTMCPLVGNEYCLKDLIYQNVTSAQPYFMGGSFRSSNGYFPTELGFSKRTIPVLAKLGISWAVMGNNHFSRTLKDYPFERLYPNLDTMVSPPNRADLRNTSTVGTWVDQQMAHEQQVIRNKLPFANTPHWVRHVDAATGAVSKVAGIPVDQAGSWLEGWEGSATVDALTPFTVQGPRQFFVIAHDGDNSQGRAGSFDTWQNGYNVTCSGGGYCLGIDEYLRAMPIPANDVQHVQDGSWIDTRDSSSDPQWHHWRLPFSIWKGQFPVFNSVTGLALAPKRNLDGLEEGMTVSFEHGFHYLERNFALLQAALNYAKTAEQIWLSSHPAHWTPTTALDRELTHTGNQLNPHMLSFPVKGNAAADYAGGANPAELAWYFLLPAMDSGFGYYDENKDDHVKGTLAFNNSLYFSRPYVSSRLTQDRTGPSVWWPQRWPYNPGSVNADKSQGWTVHHYNNNFAIYTYAHDVSTIASIVVKVRAHAQKSLDESDDTYKVYDPAAMAGRPGLSISPARVGAWRSYPMTRRDLRPVMNGVAWNRVNMDTMAVLPAQETGDLYYSYLSAYRDQLLDYYIEATDARGNVTRTEIQQVYVGTGRYNRVGNRWVESLAGTTEGTHPFLQQTDRQPPTVPGKPTVNTKTDTTVSLSWTASTDNVAVVAYDIYRDGTLQNSSTSTRYTDSGLQPAHTYRYQIRARDVAGNLSALSPATPVTTEPARDRQPPTVAGAPRAIAVAARSVTLVWTASRDNVGVHHYDVYRDNNRLVQSPTATHVDATVQPGRSYSYYVIALDAAGNASAASPFTIVRTPTNRDTQAPSRPLNLAAPVRGISSIELRWTASTDNVGVSAYDVYRGDKLAGSSGATTRFVDTGLRPDTSYSYRVIARDAAGNRSAAGGPLLARTARDSAAPTVPISVAAASISNSSFRLSWAASSDNVGVVGYEVLVGSRVINVADVSSTTVTGLASNTAYPVQVRALDAAGNRSAYSPAFTVRTLPDNRNMRVNVSVTATTNWGQNLWLVGNRKELSDWNPAGGIPCRTTAATYPRWTCAGFELPPNTRAEFKFIKRDGQGKVIWEGDQSGFSINRQLQTPAAGELNLDLSWR